MDCFRLRPSARGGKATAQVQPLRLEYCLDCCHTGQPCRPGLLLLARLGAAIAAGNPSPGFEITGTANPPCAAGPCLLAWRATPERACLFGGMPEGAGIPAFPPGAAAGAAPLAEGAAAILVMGRGMVQ
jgi:hypothetical protein